MNEAKDDLPDRWIESHRTIDARCWVPPKVSPPLHCDALPMFGEFPRNLSSGCCLKLTLLLDTLVMSEQVEKEDAFSQILEGWISTSDAYSFFWYKFTESEPELAFGTRSALDCWSCLVLRNRPPDPLTLFKAWRCRDSWRYGCDHF